MPGGHQAQTLTPNQAVDVANGVYRILHHAHIASALPMSIKENFDIANATPFDGKSGPTLAQSTSGFGIVAMGKQNKGMSSGQNFSRDALVAIRGTQLAIDWVTDLHAGAQFIDGKLVHSGFYKVYRSILAPISHFFHRHKPQRIHVVGHSLGGAVAVLVANWIQKNTSAEPVLYTFGAPRVGGGPFAKHFTAKIKPKNIYRVYHANDPIPMVPVWPFVHAPDPGRTYCVRYLGSHFPINPEAHRIRTYAASMQGHATWDSFPQKAKTSPTDAEIRRWLLSNHTKPSVVWHEEFYYMGHAIMYILRKSGKLLLDSVELQIMKNSDDMDIFAMAAQQHKYAAALDYAAKSSEELRQLREQLVNKMLHTLNITYDNQKTSSTDLLQHLIAQMKNRLSRAARVALQAGMQ